MNENKVLVGSRRFFGAYSDFSSKDYDYVEFITNSDCGDREVHLNGKCVFQIVKRPANQIVASVLNTKLPMKAGKFLVPEFNKAVGFTFKDLPKLKRLFDKIDDKHLYEKSIFESYLENGDFILTDEQRNTAYELYKKYRN